MAEMSRPVVLSEIKVESLTMTLLILSVNFKLPISRAEIIIAIPDTVSEESPENFLPRLSVSQIVNKSAGSSCTRKMISKYGTENAKPFTYHRGRNGVARVNVVVQIDEV